MLLTHMITWCVRLVNVVGSMYSLIFDSLNAPARYHYKPSLNAAVRWVWYSKSESKY